MTHLNPSFFISVYVSYNTNMVRFDGIKSYYDFRQVSAEQLKSDAQKLIDVRL